MGFIVFEEEAFNYLDAQLENFVKRMVENSLTIAPLRSL